MLDEGQDDKTNGPDSDDEEEEEVVSYPNQVQP